MAGGEPGPATQAIGTGEAPDVADLGHEHRAQYGSDPSNGLHRPVADIIDQPVGDVALQGPNLAVEGGDQAPQRVDPGSIGRLEGQLVEGERPVDTPQLAAGEDGPRLVSTPWIWDFSPARNWTSLWR